MTKLPEHRHPPGERTALKPREAVEAPGFTRLPERRHSDSEVQEIRRREAMRVRPPIAYIQSQTASVVVILGGYLLALAGGAIWLFSKTDWPHAVITRWCGVGGCVAAVTVALFIAVRKPRSRHHAALIGICGLLAIVFGLLQLLPQSHGT